MNNKSIFQILLLLMVPSQDLRRLAVAISQVEEFDRSGELHDVCEDDYFRANCPPGQVIIIDHARFGNLKGAPGHCDKDGGKTEICNVDARSYVERYCGGRRRCLLLHDSKVRDALKRDNSCLKNVFGYLEVRYNCTSVYTASDETTCAGRKPLMVSVDSGYLASVVTAETNRGSETCPWMFSGLGVESINISLIDFGTWNSTKNRCRSYGYLTYGSRSGEKKDICGGNVKLTATAADEELKIELFNMTERDTPTRHFLIKFQVSRQKPCDKYEPKTGEVLSEQDGHHAFKTTVQCLLPSSNEKKLRTLHCIGRQWQAAENSDFQPCPSPSIEPTTFTANTTSGANSNVLVWLVMVLFLALIATAIAFAVYVKRKSNTSSTPAADQAGMPGYYGPNGVVYNDPSMTAAMAYHSRSQKDLLDCCNNGPPLPPHIAADPRLRRDYATTLEMRLIGQQAGAWPPQQQGPWTGGPGYRTPDVWTSDCSTCPVHSQQQPPGTNTTGRRRANQHVYDEIASEEEMDSYRQQGGMAVWPPMVPAAVYARNLNHIPVSAAAGGGSIAQSALPPTPTSPVYNELEPSFNVGSNTCILPLDDRAGNARNIVAEPFRQAATHQTANPPFPLTKL